MPTSHDDKLSTTRLAEQAGMEARQLFRQLAENGWIERVGKQWKLTGQGELQGGSYQHSDKYGDYIVWPRNLLDGPGARSEADSWLSATRLAELYGSSAPCVNNLLAELGWQERDQRGWMLTESGGRHGGSQRNGKHGFYVLWPAGIRDNTLFIELINNVTGKVRGTCLDGHQVSNAGEQQIDNWLYLHHLVHACHHPVPGSVYSAGFYLPQRKIFIDYWGFDFSTGSLSDKLARQAFYQANGLRHIEIGDDDLPRLDEVLKQKLLPFGVQL
ncbi:MAG TPA: hypothetical protein VIN71_01985 [Pseudomonadales bacterium]